MSLDTLSEDLRSIADEYEREGLTEDILTDLEATFFTAEEEAAADEFD